MNLSRSVSPAALSRLVTRCFSVSSQCCHQDSRVEQKTLEQKPQRETVKGVKVEQHEEPQSDKPSNDSFAPFADGINPATGEIGGPTGPEPTRYGDWERKGRVTDF